MPNLVRQPGNTNNANLHLTLSFLSQRTVLKIATLKVNTYNPYEISSKTRFEQTLQE